MSQFVSSIAADDSDGLSLEFALGLYASNRLLLSRHADDDLPADERGIVIEKVYNPGVGKYDVRVITGPGFQTKRQELHYIGELTPQERIDLYLDTV